MLIHEQEICLDTVKFDKAIRYIGRKKYNSLNLKEPEPILYSKN